MRLHDNEIACVHGCVRVCVCVRTCVSLFYSWLLPSNWSFYRQIAGYGKGVGDPRVGQW